MTSESSRPRAWGVWHSFQDRWELMSAQIVKETPKRLILEKGQGTEAYSGLAFTGYRTQVEPGEVARTPAAAVEIALVKERQALAALEAKVDAQHARIRRLEELGAKIERGEV